MQPLWHLRQAGRSLRRAPGFTAIAVLTLAVGIGANAAVFSVFSAAFLEPLPYPNASRLIAVQETRQQDIISVSWPDLLDYRAQATGLEQVAGFYGQSFNLTGAGDPERIRGQVVTANLFSTLGVKPLLGRSFRDEEDNAGGPNVVAISYPLWQNRFGGDPGIIGRTISLDLEPCTVIAVMPEGFRFPDGMVYGPADLWRPMALLGAGDRQQRGSHPGLVAVGLLKPGVRVTQASRELGTIAERLRQEYAGSNHDQGVRVEPAIDNVVGDLRPALLLLLGAVGLVLLISCANVAALVLARASSRNQELAIRAALGGGLRQIGAGLLAEGLLLAALGGMAGIGLAALLLRLGSGLMSGLPRLGAVSLDWRGLGFTLGATALTGIVFGLTPVLTLRSGRIDRWLRARGGTADPPSTRTRRILVALEIGLTLVLLTSATLLLKSFAHILANRGGIRPASVLTFVTRLPTAQYNDTRTTTFYQSLLRRLEALPGVTAAGAVSVLPFSGAGAQSGIRPAGTAPGPEHESSTDVQTATPGYFAAMGIDLLRGRGIAEEDRAAAPAVAVIDERLAQAFWPGQDPIGKRVSGWGFDALTVVGVVRHVKRYGVTAESRQELYVSAAQRPSNRMTLVVRTAGDPMSLLPSVRREVAALDPVLPIYDGQPMDAVVAATVAGPRLAAVLSGAFALIALVLAIVGVYGVMAFIVGTRTREIGIRLALGALPGQVLWLVLRQTLRLAAAGVLLGLLTAIGVARALRSQMYGIGTADPATFTLLPLGLLLIALIAGLLPALRAARVSPVVALSEG